MLLRVLQAVQAADGPITLAELSRSLGIAPGPLEGMLYHWARKGRLAVDGQGGAKACGGSCAAMGTCGGCAGVDGCPFMARLPRSYWNDERRTTNDE